MSDRTLAAPAPEPASESFAQIMDYVQSVVLILLGALIVCSATVTVLCALGVLPWLEVEARIGGALIPGFGPALQVLFTLFCIALLAALPGTARVLRLERSHRRFDVTMADIARAYEATHRADREGVFTLRDDFSSVKERLAYLRDHQSLAHLEPEVMEIAAQMSFLSRDLAEVYSDEAVARARAFLKAREEEIARQRDEIDAALVAAEEIKRWSEGLNSQEVQAKQLIDRIGRDLEQVLPKLGYSLTAGPSNVLPLPPRRETR